MLWVLLFQTLLSYISGATSQPTLTQPSSESVSLGQTARLSCTISSNPSTVGWVQKRPGQIHRGVHCDGCSRGPGISDRFTATRSGSIGYLTITNTQADDEAEYYCLMWYSSGSVIVFGGGTQLTVLGQPTASPKVLLYPPSKEEIDSTQKGTLVCLIEDFYPPNIQVTWQAEGREISSGVETTKPTKQNDKYLASSYLSLTESEWKRDKSYTCKVRHEGKDFTKSVKSSECP